MRDVDIGPLLNPDDKVRFYESHRPLLMDGDYRVTVQHDVDGLEFHAQRSLPFTVAGPRFTLGPDEIASVFPPKSSAGDFEAVLPHVILKRATLPWERSATLEHEIAAGAPKRDPKEPKDTPSWLALLVFEESEIAGRTQVIKASDLMTPTTGDAPIPPQVADSFAQLSRSRADDPDASVLVLDIPSKLALDLLPQVKDLRFLTSSRDVTKTHEQAKHEVRGIVMANRFPVSGKRNIVHLVSLEHQYLLTKNADRRHNWSDTHEHWARQVAPGETLRFVSLAQWDFVCDASKGDLQHILNGLGRSMLTLKADNVGQSRMTVASGAVPLQYQLAGGEKTAGWYKGPFCTRPRRVNLPLPVRGADDLLQIDEMNGLADISYAAAWEVGRLLALKDPAIGTRLNQWKRQVAHEAHAADHTEVADTLNLQRPTSPLLPSDLAGWFDTALGRLAAVPFDYLVPDPELLQPEQIACFTLDRNWIAALMDGAFSIGRTSRRQLMADSQLRGVLTSLANTERSGVLLRSRAVAGWPDLVVDGFIGRGKAAQLLTPLRYDFVGRDTLLVLFDGTINRVDIHLNPIALHFGCDGNQTAGLRKESHTVPMQSAAHRVVDISGLADKLSATGSHQFARKMIEGVPKISIQIGLSQ